MLTDPNTVLRNDNVGKTITKTVVFTVSTQAVSPELAGGTANIAFLHGSSAGPNADAVQMSATFWIETVQYVVAVPPFKPGQVRLTHLLPSIFVSSDKTLDVKLILPCQYVQPPLKLSPIPPHPGALVPTFLVDPPKEIAVPTKIIVTATQIQYSQMVFLNFAGLTWPHVSVATLVPSGLQIVPASAFN